MEWSAVERKRLLYGSSRSRHSRMTGPEGFHWPWRTWPITISPSMITTPWSSCVSSNGARAPEDVRVRHSSGTPRNQPAERLNPPGEPGRATGHALGPQPQAAVSWPPTIAKSGTQPWLWRGFRVTPRGGTVRALQRPAAPQPPGAPSCPMPSPTSPSRRPSRPRSSATAAVPAMPATSSPRTKSSTTDWVPPRPSSSRHSAASTWPPCPKPAGPTCNTGAAREAS